MLTHEQRRKLLRIAREAIEAVLRGERPDVDLQSIDETLRRPAGAFVSLHTAGGELRGCIGSIHPVAPLVMAVSSSAVNAAFRDPRFFPLKREELPGIELEISVMGPIERVVSVDEIEVGRDGLIVSLGGRIGLLLPQVATDQGWDRDSFLSHTCLKAGLLRDSWRSQECRIERFAAEVFSE
jgi:AmmeMemoRadiSam system protein A